MKTKLKILLAIANSLFVLSLVAQTPSLEWAVSMGGVDHDTGRHMVVDSNGYIYTSGWFRGTVDFDPGDGIYELSSPLGDNVTFIQKMDTNGNFLWAKLLGDVIVRDMAIDSYDNIYFVGTFFGTVDFDPGDDAYNLTSIGSYSDVFIQKLDNHGAFLWALHTDANSSVFDIDDDGNIYTLGTFVNTVDFDPGDGVFNLTSTGIGGANNFFIQKLDINGNFIWAVRFGNESGTNPSVVGTYHYLSFSIATDSNKNIYTTGLFVGTVDFDPGIQEENVTATSVNQGWNTFIQKLDADGNYLWAKHLDIMNYASSITLDNDNSVFVCGGYKGTADFDPGDGEHIQTSSSTFSNDIFIEKLDTNGNFLFSVVMGSILDDYATSIAIDANGNVFTIGLFSGLAVDFDPGDGVYELTPINYSEDIFIQQLDKNGNFIWAVQMGGSSVDTGDAIVFNQDGNIYTCGAFIDTADFDPDVDNSYELTSNGGHDIYILKLSDNNLGIADNSFLEEYVLYPNPAHDVIQVAGLKTQESYAIYDLQGRLILKGVYDSNEHIHISQLTNGLYFLKFESGESFRFVKE